MMQTWWTAVATPTAAAEPTHCAQQPRDFVHLTAATTALHNIAQQLMPYTSYEHLYSQIADTMQYIYQRDKIQ